MSGIDFSAGDGRSGVQLHDGGRRYLCSVDGGEVVAYATPTGHDFFQAADQMPWAHESDGLLLSARSGAPLARRSGTVFHDLTTDELLYYERTDASDLR
jgi:hypothetical protein